MDIKDKFINKFKRFSNKKEIVKYIERGVESELSWYGSCFRDICWELDEQDENLRDLEIIKDDLGTLEEYLNNELIEIEEIKEKFEKIYSNLTEEQKDQIELELLSLGFSDINKIEENIEFYIYELDTYFDLLNKWKLINDEKIENITNDNKWDKKEKESNEMYR
ncbi:hypothetical protein [Streptobacillus moniliformis]|uniref:hypothetical protein n=1 Tax=Streptobacillus moniliformis TaxID=34105 RepID=UPI0007E473CA|nr:hypothetical protein [Streptobacillus moniliformis]